MRLLHKRRREPRYTVGSVTGFMITQGSQGGAGGKPPKPLWSVHDSAYCYRTLWEGWSETEARAMAARLNAETSG